MRETTPVRSRRQGEGGFNCSVLICIWSCDLWREGWIRKWWSRDRQEESGFSSAKAPWVGHTEAAFVWPGTRVREGERGGDRGESEPFRLEWERQSGLHLSPFTQDNFSLDHWRWLLGKWKILCEEAVLNQHWVIFPTFHMFLCTAFLPGALDYYSSPSAAITRLPISCWMVRAKNNLSAVSGVLMIWKWLVKLCSVVLETERVALRKMLKQ